MTSLVAATLAHVIAVENDRSRMGAALVTPKNGFNRQGFIKDLIDYFLGADYDPATEDFPTMLVCRRNPHQLAADMQALNRRLPKRWRGSLLTADTRPEQVRSLTFGTYAALRDARRLDTDAFDMVVVNAFTPNEIDNYRHALARLEPAFLVLIVSPGMQRHGELAHWPQLGEPYLIGRPANTPQPAPAEL